MDSQQTSSRLSKDSLNLLHCRPQFRTEPVDRSGSLQKFLPQQSLGFLKHFWNSLHYLLRIFSQLLQRLTHFFQITSPKFINLIKSLLSHTSIVANRPRDRYSVILKLSKDFNQLPLPFLKKTTVGGIDNMFLHASRIRERHPRPYMSTLDQLILNDLFDLLDAFPPIRLRK